MSQDIGDTSKAAWVEYSMDDKFSFTADPCRDHQLRPDPRTPEPFIDACSGVVFDLES